MYRKILFASVILSMILTASWLTANSPVVVRADTGLEQIGIVSARPSGTTGEWIIGEVSFEADSSTIFEYEHGPLDIGVCAEVQYNTNGGINTASEIESKEAQECGGGNEDNHMQTYGRIDNFPADLIGDWNIDGISYTADSATQFEQEHGAFAVSACVEIKYQPDTNAAIEIETEHDYKCNGGDAYSNLYGLVDSFPAGLVGDWVIDGITYTADANTQFEQSEGPFIIGGCVEIKYIASTNTAHEIESSTPSDCDGSPVPAEMTFYGLISVIPADNIGTWVIGSENFESSVDTQLEEEHGQFASGVCVEVQYYDDNGINRATSIEAEDPYHCNGGTSINTVYGMIDSYPAVWYGSWVIDGVTYAAYLETTEFDEDNGPFAVGACVKMRYFSDGGVNTAVEIETEDETHCTGGSLPDDNKVYAIIDSFPADPYLGTWSIGGVDYEATADTQFTQSHGSFAIGACVEAKYNVNAGINELSEVETENAYKCQENGEDHFTSYGAVEVLPASPDWIGIWQVGGIDYQTDLDTEFEQEHGFFAVGAYVEVSYVISGSINLATSIETHVAPGAGTTTVFGLLTAHDDSDDWNDWVVDGVTYKADPVIETGTGEQAPQVGKTAMFNAYQVNGVWYVTTAVLAHSIFLPVITR